VDHSEADDDQRSAGTERLDLVADFRGFAVDRGDEGVAEGGDRDDEDRDQQAGGRRDPDLQPG